MQRPYRIGWLLECRLLFNFWGYALYGHGLKLRRRYYEIFGLCIHICSVNCGTLLRSYRHEAVLKRTI